MPFQQAASSLYTAYLREAGVEVEFVLYKDAGHSLSKEPHKKDRLGADVGLVPQASYRIKLTFYLRASIGLWSVAIVA